MDVIQYQIGPCTLDCSIMTLSCGSQSVKLSAKVFELLKLFIESPDHIVSRQMAIDVIWDGNQGVGEKGTLVPDGVQSHAQLPRTEVPPVIHINNVAFAIYAIHGSVGPRPSTHLLVLIN